MPKCSLTGVLSLILLWQAAGATTGRAQQLLAPDQARRAHALFRTYNGNPGKCSAAWSGPRLDYGLRFVFGFQLYFPLKNFRLGKDGLLALARITPDGQAPVMLGLPLHAKGPVPEAGYGEADGAVLLGPGRYRADLLLVDPQDHFCTVHRNVTVRQPSRTRGLQVVPAPGSVFGIFDPVTMPAPPVDGPRMTILLHASPPRWRALRSTVLRATERAALLGSVASLVSNSGFAHFRLVAYNLEQQAEVFRREEFVPNAFPELAAALEKLQLGTVSYSVIQNRSGWEDQLAGIVNAESASRQPSDAVVFVGWPSTLEKRVRKEALQQARRGTAFYNLQCWRGAHRGQEYPDVVERLVSDLGGRTFRVHDPVELAGAITKLKDAEVGATATPTARRQPVDDPKSRMLVARPTAP